MGVDDQAGSIFGDWYMQEEWTNSKCIQDNGTKFQVIRKGFTKVGIEKEIKNLKD